MEPTQSPALWTTIATGVGPERHGIHGFVVPKEKEARPAASQAHLVEGESGGEESLRPVTSSMRTAPAFWNILSSLDLRAGVVGWLVTWPAEPVNGFIVSSYLPYIYSWSTGRPLKGTIVEGIPRQTFPEGLIEEIDALKVRPADLKAEMVRRFYDPSRIAGLGAEDRECVTGFLWTRRIGASGCIFSPGIRSTCSPSTSAAWMSRRTVSGSSPAPGTWTTACAPGTRRSWAESSTRTTATSTT
jgi:hypothetical protein